MRSHGGASIARNSHVAKSQKNVAENNPLGTLRIVVGRAFNSTRIASLADGWLELNQ